MCNAITQMLQLSNFQLKETKWTWKVTIGLYPLCAVLVEFCHTSQNLFRNVLHSPQHVLHQLLPPVSATSHSYSLRTRTHNRQLPDRLSHLADCNFITRMLFYQSYWHLSAFITSFTVNDVNVFVCSNAVYILLRCCNCGLPVINKRICYVVLENNASIHPSQRTAWDSSFITYYE